MKRVFVLIFSLAMAAGLSSCGSQATSNPGVDISGNWNVFFTLTSQTTASYGFGMKFTKQSSDVSGTEITFTGGTQPGTTCINYGKLTASGNVSGETNITMTLTDPTTNSSFTINATPNSNVTQMVGDFNAIFGANGGNPACAAQSGSVLMTKQ